MVTFNQGLRPHMGEQELLALVAHSDEFESMMVRGAWLAGWLRVCQGQHLCTAATTWL
jgi:hypothetical protein